jgi:O-antigen/teichoic acid export membrane protein
LVFLITQGDDIFVGKLLGVTALGFYQLAYRISNMPATEITHVISQVTFPAYSKLQGDISKLKEAYLKVLRITTLLSFPIAGIIFVLAADFTNLLLGGKWMPIVPAMQVLVFWGLIRSIGATTGPLMYATGQPEILTRYLIFQLIVLVISVYPFTVYWGIFGTSCAVLAASIAANALAFYRAIKITGCGTKNFLKTISLPFMASVVAVLFAFLVKTGLIILNMPVTSFILSVTSYCLVYLVVMYLLDRLLDRSLTREVLSTLMKA